MKTKQKNQAAYVLLGIFIIALICGFFRYIYTDSYLRAHFRSLGLKHQQKIVRVIGVYVSPYIARSFIYWLNLPPEVMHDIIPILGESAYHALGDKGFAVCDGVWAVYCYKGVMTGTIQRFGYTPTVLSDATISCQKHSLLNAPESLCAQAAGYSVLWLNLYWYIESLQYCDRVFSKTTGKYDCWIGVSHENVQRAGDSLRGLYEVPWSAENKHYPCDSIPLEYQPACAAEQIKAIRDREFYGDTQKSIDYCNYFSYKETQKACISALEVQN